MSAIKTQIPFHVHVLSNLIHHLLYPKPYLRPEYSGLLKMMRYPSGEVVGAEDEKYSIPAKDLGLGFIGFRI